jgi:glycosyltransferase involved in cell wall biosynthesis
MILTPEVGEKKIASINNTDNAFFNICYILLHIPVPSETFVINEILALQSLGVDVYTVALWPPHKCHEELVGSIKNPIYDLSDKSIPQKAVKSSFYSAACTLAANYDIPLVLAAQAALAAEYVLEHSIKHIHAHFATEAALVSLLVSKLIGIPFSFTAHAYDIFRLNVSGETFPDRRVKLLVENAAKTITISEYNRNHILSITGPAVTEKLEVVHCGIDPERFNPCVRKSQGTVTFLSVGRLVEKKGHDYLLRAFKGVADSCDVCLRIVGDGSLRPQLTALVEEMGITDKVTFIGAVSSDIVLKEMRDADVFVLHSVTGHDGDREGVPVSIMEACATGLPVIATRHAGIPELIIEGVNGFLVDERDWQGFAGAMQKLAVSRELREKMGFAGHEIVTDNFNLINEAQKLKAIFSSTVIEYLAKNKPLIINSDLSRSNFHFFKRKIKNVLKRLLSSR